MEMKTFYVPVKDCELYCEQRGSGPLMIIMPDGSNDADVYFNRGAVYGNLGEYNLAIADFSKCIELNSNYGEAYYYRGITYQELGDKKKAQADFAKAKELGYKG